MLRTLFAFAAFLLAAWIPANAQSAEHKANVSLISERLQTSPGDTFFAAFDMKLAPGWHVYWRNPGDSGLPPAVAWDEGLNLNAGDLVLPSADETKIMISNFLWPAPVELAVLENELLDYGYNDRLVLPFQVAVPQNATGSVRLSGKLQYLICKEVCIPEDAEFDVTVELGGTLIIDEVTGRTIASWIAMTPSTFEGESCLVAADERDWMLSLRAPELVADVTYARFFPYENEIRHAAKQSFKQGADGLVLKLEPGYVPELGEQLSGVLVVEKAGGARQAYEVAAPLCANTLPGTGLSTGQGIAALGGNGGSANGINLLAIASLALLGGLILNLMPCVLPVLSIKAVGMVSATVHGNASHLRAHGLWYTFGVVLSFLGIASAFLGLRAAGEFVSLGFQLQYAPVVAVLALIMFVIGLWLLGLFELGTSLQNVGDGLASKQGNAGAFFTGVLAAVVGAPCIGPFLGVALGAVITEPAPIVLFVFGIVGFGLALPFLLLSFVPNLQRLLPKPGIWMVRLKQAFALPMFLTAAWLLSVLGQQAGVNAIIWTVIGAALIGVGVWLARQGSGRLKTMTLGLSGALLIGGVFLPIQASVNGVPPVGGAEQTYSAAYASEAWTSARVDELVAEGRGVFVDFTATWCVTCQLNKRTTLARPSVQAAFAENDIVFMIADFTNHDEDIAAALQLHERPGVPMYLYYPPGGGDAELLPQILSPDVVLSAIKASSET